MTVIVLGDMSEKTGQEYYNDNESFTVFLTNSLYADKALSMAEIIFDGETDISEISFSKLEIQPECLYGTLCIPKLTDITGSRYRIQLLINKRHIVIIDDETFSERLIKRMENSKVNSGKTRERFLYSYLSQILSRDTELMGQYEHQLMTLEDKIISGRTDEIQLSIMHIRKELLTLRNYYDEMLDFGKELEEDENNFFAKKQLKYFGIISDRADRLKNRTIHLLDYAQQIRDAYHEKIEEEQTRNMQFLTVISTIFFPLTLITGWYGMNFDNMPELKHGYPFVIVFSIIILIICILFFKKKKML